MEIIIGLLIIAGLAFYLIRKNKEVDAPVAEVPYKVEAPVAEVAPVVVPQSTDTTATEWPMVDTAPKAKPRARKPAAPRAPAKPKAVPAKPTKAKAPAIKATPAKKPRAPKAK